MISEFQPGDHLVFQIESGFCLLKILGVETSADRGAIWHLKIFGEFYPDVESAEFALNNPSTIRIAVNHVAMTDRAFLSTQASLLKNLPLENSDIEVLEMWRKDLDAKVSDRSVRLLLGLR